MNNVEKVKNAVATTKTISLAEMIEQQMPRMLKVAPKHIDGVRYTAMAISLIKRNPKLYECDPYTVLGSFFQCIELGLEPMDGQAYILPFRNKGKMEAQLIIGYKGLAQLFYRHASGLSLDWGAVHVNDFFDYEKGTAPFLKHKKAEGDRGEVKGYYVIAKMSNAGMVFDYMQREECLAHGKKYSKTWNSEKGAFGYYSPWATAEDQMCLKTVLRGIMKLLPKSVEIQKALEGDERIVSYNPTNAPQTLLDMPDRTDWREEKPQTEAIEAPKSSPEPQKPTLSETSPETLPMGVPEGEELPKANSGDIIPSSSDLKNTSEARLREEIGIMIGRICKGNDAIAPKMLQGFTAFSDFAGYSNIHDVKATSKTGKRTQLEVTHSKVKKEYLELIASGSEEVKVEEE